jgi:hypothetical protein
MAWSGHVINPSLLKNLDVDVSFVIREITGFPFYKGRSRNTCGLIPITLLMTMPTFFKFSLVLVMRYGYWEKVNGEEIHLG